MGRNGGLDAIEVGAGFVPGIIGDCEIAKLLGHSAVVAEGRGNIRKKGSEEWFPCQHTPAIWRWRRNSWSSRTACRTSSQRTPRGSSVSSAMTGRLTSLASSQWPATRSPPPFILCCPISKSQMTCLSAPLMVVLAHVISPKGASLAPIFFARQK